jgi:hypothetical protein
LLIPNLIESLRRQLLSRFNWKDIAKLTKQDTNLKDGIERYNEAQTKKSDDAFNAVFNELDAKMVRLAAFEEQLANLKKRDTKL